MTLTNLVEGQAAVALREPILTGQGWQDVSYTKAGKLIALNRKKEEVAAISLEDGLATPRIRGRHFDHAAVSPDGRFIFTSEWLSMRAEVWDAQTGALLTELPIGQNWRGAFSPDGLTSMDGINWTSAVSLLDITYNGSSYFGLTPKLSRSSDGLTWESHAPVSFKNLHFGNNIFLGSHDGGEVYTSPDGISWTQVWTSPTRPMNFSQSYFENGLFFVSGNALLSTPVPHYPYSIETQYRTLHYSLDGTRWELACKDGWMGKGLSIIAGGGYYVVGTGREILYSRTLTNDWTPVTVSVPPHEPEFPNWSGPENPSHEFAFGNDVFVSVWYGELLRSNPVEGTAAATIHKQPKSFAAVIGATAEFSLAYRAQSRSLFNGAETEQISPEQPTRL